MKEKVFNLKKICIITIVFYIIVSIVFYLAAGNQLNYQKETSNMINPLSPIGEITSGTVVEQEVSINADYINSVTLYMATYGRINKGHINIAICNDKKILNKISQDVSMVVNNKAQTFIFDEPIPNHRNEKLTLRIWSDDCTAGNAVTIMYGNYIDTSRGQVSPDLEKWERVRINGQILNGQLCYQVEGTTKLWYGKYYWIFSGLIGVILSGYLLRLLYVESKGSNCLGLRTIDAFFRYNFLIKQLVSRDFKTKYKRSILGVFWSFLNPLLSMLVQYFVFSNIFKTDTENFVVYLLIGIVFFNFYSEATNMAMSSIVGNSALITKVYVPKYIYPFSRSLSSVINFLISLVPLACMICITGVQFAPAFILSIYPMVCIFILSSGIGLMLSTVMVFFRDTQFIYGVLLTALMYFTPIFYPITIIPEKYRWLFSLNPISNNIVFMRSCILDGVFPGMKLFVLCGGVSIIVFVCGALVFKKNQDKFILHI